MGQEKVEVGENFLKSPTLVKKKTKSIRVRLGLDLDLFFVLEKITFG